MTAQSIEAAVASSGLAIGALAACEATEILGRTVDFRDSGRNTLACAIKAAMQHIRGLIERNADDGSAAEIMEFQAAMLADPELSRTAFQAIDDGLETVPVAWKKALDAEIASYEQDADEYFRTRASDLRDLRDFVLRQLAVQQFEMTRFTRPTILFADDLGPGLFLEMQQPMLKGIALAGGSASSHVAMLARSRSLPMVIGIGGALHSVADGESVILDARTGKVILYPDPRTVKQYESRLEVFQLERDAAMRCEALPAASANGVPIRVALNIDDLAVLQTLDPAHCDGIGLTRTESLFHMSIPDEDRQYGIYRSLIRWAKGRPVTIRTFDAGGDKPVPGLSPATESNPFLGLRGLRLSLARREVFAIQLRALARAAVHGPLRVMFPMVTVPEELELARKLLAAEIQKLRRSGIGAEMPIVGIMVETPAAALNVDAFDADFFSVGTNDLTQFVMAAGRGSAAVAYLQDPLNPAVVELITRVAEVGAKRDAEVSVCGEMAARAAYIPTLLSAGIRVLSVPPAALGRAKLAVSQTVVTIGDE